MNKKRNILLAVLLVAVIMIGIGYAAMTNVTLNINGTASATTDANNFKVKFDRVATPTTNTNNIVGANVSATVTDDTNATIAVSGLTTKGQKVTATYTVKNESADINATLSATNSNDNPTYFKVSEQITSTTLNAAGSTTVVVTVELIKTPVTEQTANIGVQLTAAPQQI